MLDMKKTCKVAVVQAAPVMFDKKQSLDKVISLIETCHKQQAELIVFPELCIPGYPYGMSFGFSVGARDAGGRRDWKQYYDNSVVVPGPETKRLGEAARSAKAWLSVGISERDAVTATLYNSNLLFSLEGELVFCHRKLKPTGSERVVWGDADRGYFPVGQTPWGPVGSLICWESYMPLARAALYQKGITIYIAPNTNDNTEWQDTVRHIAIEGHCYVINCDMFFTKAMYPNTVAYPEEIEKLPDTVCRGGSSIIDPYGHEIVGPIWDKEDILYAELDMDAVAASRMEFDACGHYARPDVLQLHVEDK